MNFVFSTLKFTLWLVQGMLADQFHMVSDCVGLVEIDLNNPLELRRIFVPMGLGALRFGLVQRTRCGASGIMLHHWVDIQQWCSQLV